MAIMKYTRRGVASSPFCAIDATWVFIQVTILLCWQGGSSIQPQMVARIVVRPSIDDRRIDMATHHGGKVGSAAKTLVSKGSSGSATPKAGKTLANRKAAKH